MPTKVGCPFIRELGHTSAQAGSLRPEAQSQFTRRAGISEAACLLSWSRQTSGGSARAPACPRSAPALFPRCILPPGRSPGSGRPTRSSWSSSDWPRGGRRRPSSCESARRLCTSTGCRATCCDSGRSILPKRWRRRGRRRAMRAGRGRSSHGSLPLTRDAPLLAFTSRQCSSVCSSAVNLRGRCCSRC